MMEMKISTDKTQDIIRSAVSKLAEIVRPTFGPSSGKVIIDTQLNKTILDDGVQVARDLKLEDPLENAVLQIIKDAPGRASDRAGDYTTTSIILLDAILKESQKQGVFGRKAEIELQDGLRSLKETLKSSAQKISSKQDLKKVARISFDNEEIAELIADLYWKLGKGAVIEVGKSQTFETYADVSEGIALPNGYISPYMVNVPERMECVIENPYFLFTDYRLTNTNDVLPIINKMAEDKRSGLVIIAENVEEQALATLITNHPNVIISDGRQQRRGQFLSCAVVAPKTTNRLVALSDLALLTGGKVFSAEQGSKVDNAEISDLGRAERFICRKGDSVIIDPKGDKKSVDKAVSDLTKSIQNEKNPKSKEELEKRLAYFTNSIAIIMVGAPTENARKALERKIQNVKSTVGSAYKHGVVAGGGFALKKTPTTSWLLSKALHYPNRIIIENAGMEIDALALSPAVELDKAYNFVTNKSGNFMDIGVADPIDSLIYAVESAVSIASLLLNTKRIMVEVEKEITK